nr:ThiF family adenylyltransferase [Kineococcus aurantiacus]
MTYTRRGVSAALGLEVSEGPDGNLLLKALRTAPDDLATRRIRAGTGADRLSGKRVTVVGVGAIGSVAADLLHRSGVGHLHLIDADIVLPGNTTRHLIGEQAIGQRKVHAVATALRAARPHGGAVTVEDGEVATASAALRVLTTADLVLDATADSTATAVLTLASKAGAGHLVSVAVLADGYAIRVDRHPLPAGTEVLPAPDLPPLAPAVYEAGCGSPVSTTPPAAVWEAAAMATRHGLAVLLNATTTSAGEQRQLHLAGAADA